MCCLTWLSDKRGRESRAELPRASEGGGGGRGEGGGGGQPVHLPQVSTLYERGNRRSSRTNKLLLQLSHRLFAPSFASSRRWCLDRSAEVCIPSAGSSTSRDWASMPGRFSEWSRLCPEVGGRGSVMDTEDGSPPATSRSWRWVLRSLRPKAKKKKKKFNFVCRCVLTLHGCVTELQSGGLTHRCWASHRNFSAYFLLSQTFQSRSLVRLVAPARPPSSQHPRSPTVSISDCTTKPVGCSELVWCKLAGVFLNKFHFGTFFKILFLSASLIFKKDQCGMWNRFACSCVYNRNLSDLR